jgi:hypothetical protein
MYVNLEAVFWFGLVIFLICMGLSGAYMLGKQGSCSHDWENRTYQRCRKCLKENWPEPQKVLD